MTWTITDRFPSWGEAGEFPPDGFFYEGGDQVNEKHLDALWNNIKGLEDETRSALTDLDSDGDGRVDAADTSINLKGNDIDTDGDGRVDAADTSTLVQNTDLFSNYYNADDNGQLLSGNAGLTFSTALQDGETLNITQGSLDLVSGSPPPSGVDLIIAYHDGTSWQKGTAILTGDGSTELLDETGSPLASYTNSSGADQRVGVMVDNGHFNTGSGSTQEIAYGVMGYTN